MRLAHKTASKTVVEGEWTFERKTLFSSPFDKKRKATFFLKLVGAEEEWVERNDDKADLHALNINMYVGRRRQVQAVPI